MFNMQQKIGIILGSGNLPYKIVSCCKKTQKNFFLLAFYDQTPPDLVKDYPHEWVNLGEINKAFSILKAQNVTDVVFCGKINRPSFSSLKLDKRGASMMAKLALRGMGDDAVLKAIIQEIEKDGFSFLGVQEILKDLFVAEGLLTELAPSENDLNNIEKGRSVLNSLSKEDVGQGVVIQEGRIIGIEAAEGTDALIKRSYALTQTGLPPVFVKLKKLHQEDRADLPVIGTDTIMHLKEAGFAGLAIQADNTILIDKLAIIEKANALKLFIVAIANKI